MRALSLVIFGLLATTFALVAATELNAVALRNWTGVLKWLVPVMCWVGVLALVTELFFATPSENDRSRWRIGWLLATSVYIPCAILSYAALYRLGAMSSDMQTVHMESLYTAVYFSIVTWTTLGYGDISPTPEYFLVCASEALLGYLTMSLLIGVFIQSLNQR